MSSLHWYQRNFFQTLIRERQVRFGFVVTALVLIFALVGPLFVAFEPTALVGMTYGPPEGKSFLGYDYIGHDVWSRVLAGGASIIWMTLAASLVALVIGVVFQKVC